MGTDHVLNVNLCVKFVIPFIFTDIHRVKTQQKQQCMLHVQVVCLLCHNSLNSAVARPSCHCQSFALVFVPITVVR